MSAEDSGRSCNSVKRVCQYLIDQFERAEDIKQSRYAFLPAALEVQETPPSPIGRAIIWTVVLLFIVALIWAMNGKMDVVATASGKIIPSGRIKTVQPLEIGKVKSLHVKEGQLVSKGDLLITLDSTATQADTDQLANQLRTAQAALIRNNLIDALLSATSLPNNWKKNVKAAFDQANLNNIEADQSQLQLLIQQIEEYLQRRKTLQSQLIQRRAEKQRSKARVVKLKRTLPLISERVQSLKKLMDKQMAARDQYLELEQQRIEREQDLEALRAQEQELDAAIQTVESQLKTLRAEIQKDNLIELNETKQRIAALEQELVKAHKRNKEQAITAPIDGTIQQLAIHTVGGVVTPAQNLMQIVPKASQLEVEARVLNRDIGFVEEGQIAEVKVDTFNFTKYGTIDAQIAQLSNDAINDENLGLVYLAKVLIKKTQMQINNKLVSLSPGMSVTVEVKTGKRRIIEYFLSPLLRYKQESIRER